MDEILLEALRQQYELTKKVAIAINNQKFNEVRDEWNNVMSNTELLLNSAKGVSSDESAALPLHDVTNNEVTLFCGVKKGYCPHELKDRRCSLKQTCLNQVAKL